MRKCFVYALAFAVMLVVSAGRASAQNAQITGTVKDDSGAVVPGVAMTARNQETGLVRTVVTDATGSYRLPALPPGIYEVTVELQGFNAETRSDIQLVIDQTVILTFTLKPATLEESITVTAEAAVIDTTRSDVSTAVTQQQMQDLPVASRRWVDLAMLTPGTSQDGIRGQFYRGNVNIGAGVGYFSNAFIVDGVNNTWAEMGEPRQNFAMDSIREFKVTTSNFKAEHGLATGGLLVVVSKSGTNELHGSGLLFFRDKSLTAKTYFEAERPDFRRYQYGGSIGGPIIKNKTHFFFAYERTDENQFMTVSTRGVWPLYDGTYPSDQWRWNYTAKVDHQLTDSQSVFVRWAKEDEYRPIITAGGTTPPERAYDFAVPRFSLAVAHTWVISDKALNDFRYQDGYSKYIVAPPYSHGNWDAGDFGPDRLGWCKPVFSYPSIGLGGCGNSQMGPERRWQLKDDFSYLLGDWGGMHQWKMGVDYSYITFQADSMGSPLGSWSFPKDALYDPNDNSTWPTQYSHSLPGYADTPVHHFSTYVQDDWEPARGLTLNLGLRYDLQRGAFNEDLPDLFRRIEDRLGPGFGYPLPIPFHEGADRRGDYNNFGPRVGMAWDPSGSGRSNVHAAYGMFYENVRTLNNHGEVRWPQSQSIVIRNPSYPDALQGRSREEFLSTAPPNITVLSNDMVNAYAHQFNVGMTRMLTSDLGMTVDLTWVERRKERESIDPNLPDEITRQRPYPQFNRVSFSQNTSDNRYRALLAKVEKRMSNGYQFLASYTLSKAETMGLSNSDPLFYGYKRERGNSSADRRHRLVLSGVVALPYDMQISTVADFRSSLPFGVSTPYDLNRDGYGSDRPPGVTPSSGCRDLNLDAVNELRVSRGLTPVSEVTCPGFANVDLRLSKSVRIKGSHRIELIAQLFNVFNRANFGTPVGGATSSLFGQVTNLLANINAPSRQVEFAIRYQF